MVTDRSEPPEPRVSSKTSVYSAIGFDAAAVALSSKVSVQVLELAPAPGTVGVKVAVRVWEEPKLSKYSIGTVFGSPEAPTAVSSADRLTPSTISVVGEATNCAPAMDTGRIPVIESRSWVTGCSFTSSGQPSSAKPEAETSVPFLSGEKLSVGFSRSSGTAALMPSIGVTGSMPRPTTARSSACSVDTNEPCAEISRRVVEVTPPAV